VLVVAAFAVGACGHGSSPEGTVTAENQPTGTAPPASPTPLRTATATPAAMRLPTGDPVGQLAVYSTQRPAAAGFPPSKSREVQAFDTGSGRAWAAFTYDGGGGYFAEQLIGRDVVYGTPSEVDVRSLSGGQSRQLFATPDGTEVSGMSVSPTGKLLAVTVHDVTDDFGRGKALILDIAKSPAVIVRSVTRNDPQLGGFSGWFATPTWLAGDAGILVVGASGKEGPGGRATLFVDGRVVVNQSESRVLSPDGRLVYESLSSPCPYVFYGPNVTVADAATQKRVTEYIAANGGAAAAYEWAPDSSAVLIQAWARPTDGCNAKSEWLLLPASGAAPTPVPDPDSLRRQWYGATIFEISCDKPGGAALAPASNGYLFCNSSPDSELTIGGKPAGTARNVRTIGVTR
jgi:hypothetical protein